MTPHCAIKIKLISYYINLIFNAFTFHFTHVANFIYWYSCSLRSSLETKWSKIQGFIKNLAIRRRRTLPSLNKKSTALGGMLFVLNVPPFKIFLAIFYKAGLYFRGLTINFYQKYMINNLPIIYPLKTA